MSQEDNSLDFRRFIRAARQWKWLLIAGSLLLIIVGTWFGLTRLPQYELTGEMLIGDNSSDSDSQAGGISQMMRTFSVGGFSATAVNNEVIILGSHDVMLRTVRSLGLNRTYYATNTKGKNALLYRETPVRIEAPVAVFDTLSSSFIVNIKIKENGRVDLKAQTGFFKRTIAEVRDITLPYMLQTPFGIYNIMPTDEFEKTDYKKIKVSVIGNELAANILEKQVKIKIPDKLADIISLTYKSANAELGKAVINGVMGEYNAKRRDRLHEASTASIKYYDGRIADTFKELQAYENSLSDYKRKNELMGIDSELGILVGDAFGTRRSIRDTHYNIAYYETVLDILRNRLNDDVIIPAVETLGDGNVGAFNEAIQQRRELRRSATEDNEALIRLNERIAQLRDLIIENSTKQLAKSKADLRHTEALAATAENRLDKYPDYELELRNLARNGDHLNSLYHYLVSQRENAVLQLYSTFSIGFVFQEAYVKKSSGFLAKLLYTFVAIVLAIICAVCWCMFITLRSRKVIDPMDIAKLGIEKHAINYCDNVESLNRMRSWITASPKTRTIYCATFNDTTSTRKAFVRALLDAGLSVEEFSGFDSNDSILRPEVQTQIDSALNNANYVIVDVANPENVADLVNLIDRPEAILLVNIRSKNISRKEFKSILKGQNADKVFTIITH